MIPVEKQRHTVYSGWFILMLYATFVGLGLPDTGFGVAWNEMRLDFGAPLEAAGVIAATITATSALSAFSSARVIQRFGYGKVTAVSVLMTAVAVIGFSISPSFWFIVLFAVLLGLGAGSVDSGLNSFAAENLSSRQMNWLHSAWGIGATVSPMMITFGIVSLGNWRLGYGMIGVVLLILVFVLVVTLPMWRHSSKKETESTATKKADRPAVQGIAPVLSVMTFVLYVAIEAGLGLWLSALLIESRGLEVSLAGTLVGVYFGSIMAGRVLMGFLANWMGNRRLITLGLCIAISGALLFLVPTTTYVYVVSIILIGLGFAPLFPSLMHETTSRYPYWQARKIISYQVSFSYISVLLLVPLMGLLAGRVSLEVIPWITAGVIVALWATVFNLNRLT
ncbi:MFS transporter [Salisediminibacterium beveridgei]|uniref:Permeases of the major facilitator superfamily n=1 Tax=Salisediminibacterium beveridgei TaxID=632773 RepID=A0A1D7QZ19_9BACI|nr:MFS transporter [Salisediminibacterium beveridgei]AOM84251.1 Permeases of the major facilitator superfamily [Salisediminibacterium beveridgei]